MYTVKSPAAIPGHQRLPPGAHPTTALSALCLPPPKPSHHQFVRYPRQDHCLLQFSNSITRLAKSILAYQENTGEPVLLNPNAQTSILIFCVLYLQSLHELFLAFILLLRNTHANTQIRIFYQPKYVFCAFWDSRAAQWRTSRAATLWLWCVWRVKFILKMYFSFVKVHSNSSH